MLFVVLVIRGSVLAVYTHLLLLVSWRHAWLVSKSTEWSTHPGKDEKAADVSCNTRYSNGYFNGAAPGPQPLFNGTDSIPPTEGN